MDDKTSKCPFCDGDAGDNWFDRSLCPCDDVMHTRCRNCGYALDGCAFDKNDPPTDAEVAYFKALEEATA